MPKSYVIQQDYKAPYVRMTGIPHRPQQLRFKQFKKGEIIQGELKHANNKPAFLLVAGTLVVPLSVIKELVVKDVVTHSAEGGSSAPAKKIDIDVKISKVKYIDAIVLGGIAGFAGVILAEKQNWIQSVDKKNRLYGAIAGALFASYLVYRNKNK